MLLNLNFKTMRRWYVQSNLHAHIFFDCDFEICAWDRDTSDCGLSWGNFPVAQIFVQGENELNDNLARENSIQIWW